MFAPRGNAAIVSGENKNSARTQNAKNFAQCAFPPLASGNHLQTVERENDGVERGIGKFERGRVRNGEADFFAFPRTNFASGFDHGRREIRCRDFFVAEPRQAQRNAPGAATELERFRVSRNKFFEKNFSEFQSPTFTAARA